MPLTLSLMKLTRPHLLILTLPLLVLTACVPLSQDLTPPPGAEQAVADHPAAPPTEAAYYPLVPPNPLAGKAIYLEECLPCHGEYGLGNGPEAADLPNPVAPTGDPEVARLAKPAEWYQVVTNGRIERYMPPFESLTDRQKWDVLAYVYTFSAPVEMVEEGLALYQVHCAECHGEVGQGDGSRAGEFSPPPTDFTDQAMMVERSAVALYAGISHPHTEGVPTFEGAFSEDGGWALAALMRAFSFTGPGDMHVMAGEDNVVYPPPAEEPAPTPEDGEPAEPTALAPEEETPGTDEGITSTMGTVTGQIIHFSGDAVSTDLEITLHAYDHFEEAFVISTTPAVDGTFLFDGIEIVLGRAFVAEVEYNEIKYLSNLAIIEDLSSPVEMPVTIYNTTTDMTGLIVDRMHVFFEYVPPETMRVVELLIISNPQDKVITSEEQGEAVFSVVLPDDAANLQFQEGALGERYLSTPDGFSDTRLIYPGTGEYQLLFSFDLPYDREIEFTQPMDLAISEVVALVPDIGIKFKGDQLEFDGPQDIQGASYNVYSGMDFSAGSTLSVDLNGKPKLAESAVASSSSRSELVFGLVTLAVAFIGTGAWLYRRQQVDEDDLDEDEPQDDLPAAPMPDADIDSLMDAIIALDDSYQSGELPEDAYLKRRAELKAQLDQTLAGGGA